MAAGKPVFALNKWWLTETIISWKTWEFFDLPNWDDFIEKFKIFHKKNINWIYKKQDCQNQAEQFDKKKFITDLKNIVNWQQ
jgi:hypothetical protein